MRKPKNARARTPMIRRARVTVAPTIPAIAGGRGLDFED